MNKNTIVIIPARGGSKGIPGKNIKNFNGKPLIAYSIEYALSAISPDNIFVSTDCNKIKEITLNLGVKVIDRPNAIAGDTATTESAITHALESIDFTPENIILLQATSPLRPLNSLLEILNHFKSNFFDSLLTISSTHRFFWDIDGKRAIPNYDFLRRPRRQDMTNDDIKYIENGSVYIFTNIHFNKNSNRLGGNIGYYIFPEECALEIDSMSDWIVLEQIAKLNKN